MSLDAVPMARRPPALERCSSVTSAHTNNEQMVIIIINGDYGCRQ